MTKKETLLKIMKEQPSTLFGRDYDDIYYKKISLSPIRYAGGKSHAVGHLVERMPDDVDTIVSLFAGGMSFELLCNKMMDMHIVANDINSYLIAFWNTMQDRDKRLALIERLEDQIHPDKMLNVTSFKNLVSYRNEEMQGMRNINEDYKAFMFCIINNYAFGPIWDRPNPSPVLFEKRKYTILNKIKKFELDDSIVFHNETYCDFLNDVAIHNYIKNNSVLVYADPPYYVSPEKSSNNKDDGIGAGLYGYQHEEFNHDELKAHLNVLDKLGVKWMLSYNDCTYINDLYKNYNIKKIYFNYSMHSTINKKSSELLITNYT